MFKRAKGVTRAGCAFFLVGIAGVTLSVTTPAVAQERTASSQTFGLADGGVARAIEGRARGSIKEFYESRGFRPLWISGRELNPAASHFLTIIDNAEVDGLDATDYRPERLQKLIERAASGNPKALAEVELRLSREFVRLVQDMRRPRLEMHYADDDVRPQSIPDDEVLRRASLATSFPAYVANMQWMHPFYVGLRQQLIAARSYSGLPQLEIPAGPVMREGDHGNRVSLLRRRLGLAASGGFDEELAQAVRSFQAAQGLEPDAVVGPQTLAVLNRTGARRAAGPSEQKLLQVNLERARLLPDAWTKHVVVNAASAQLAYYGEGEEQGTMKVVVGTPRTPTPMMAGMIRYATLNPYWNLPVDLSATLIAPRVLAGNSLSKMGYEVLSDWTAEAKVIDPATVDWKRVAAGDITARVRQLPGANNSMGDVKFMFPNDLGIFLHDTPNRALFNEPARQFSNGCVRLEDADRLGTWLFGSELKADTREPEQHRHLPNAVPVYLTYLTAVPTGHELAYFSDVYSRDRDGGAQLASR